MPQMLIVKRCFLLCGLAHGPNYAALRLRAKVDRLLRSRRNHRVEDNAIHLARELHDITVRQQ